MKSALILSKKESHLPAVVKIINNLFLFEKAKSHHRFRIL